MTGSGRSGRVLRTTSGGTSFGIRYPPSGSLDLPLRDLSVWIKDTNTFYFYVQVHATNGSDYYIRYEPSSGSPYPSGSYAIMPVGTQYKDGTWRELRRDLDADLRAVFGVGVERVLWFCIRGNYDLDDLRLLPVYQQTYDAENRLTGMSGAASATFVYDGDGNRVKEVSYENVAAGIRASSSSTLNWPDVVTNGDTWADSGSGSSGEFAYTAQTGLQYVQLDLGAVHSVDKVRVWHFAADGRIYNATKTQVSADGSSWYTVFDSAVSGTYAETAEGRTYTFTARNVRYIRDYLNGSNKNNSNHWVEIEVWGTRTTAYVGAHYEKNVTANTTTSYYTAAGQRVAMRKAGVVYYLHGDHLGSASVTTDASGAKVGELRYYPYGGTRYIGGVTRTDRRFTGQIEDAAIGLYFYNARYYDPALGRFVQADTIVPSPGNPQAHNRYAYVANNPLRYSDPTGHGWFDELLIAWGQSGSIGRATLVSMSEAAQSLVDPERSPSMEGIRQTVGKGVEAVGMAGAVADYTVQAASEGRWGDAARGTSGLAQMSGAAIAKSPEMAAQFAEGIVVGPFANAWDFGVSMRECAQGTRSGWDVAYHGLGVAATMLGTGRVLNNRLAAQAEMATRSSSPPATSGWDPTTPPGSGFEWRGRGPAGSSLGSWYNPTTGEYIHLDSNHTPPIGPHNDYRAPNGSEWRIFPDGRIEPK